MATNISNLDFGLALGFFGGIVAFFRGFRTYRESRLLQNTPGTPIRSIAMGFCAHSRQGPNGVPGRRMAPFSKWEAVN
jgi:hypothetical protein